MYLLIPAFPTLEYASLDISSQLASDSNLLLYLDCKYEHQVTEKIQTIGEMTRRGCVKTNKSKKHSDRQLLLLFPVCDISTLRGFSSSSISSSPGTQRWEREEGTGKAGERMARGGVWINT